MATLGVPPTNIAKGALMKVQVDITTPTTIRPNFRWTAPVHPAVGDAVLLGQNDLCWAFRVEKRLLSIGRDPMTGEPSQLVSLTVDTEAPAGWVG